MIRHLPVSAARLLGVLGVLTGLVLMHGIGMSALTHCLDHRHEVSMSHVQASGQSLEPASTIAAGAAGCGWGHDAGICVAASPKWPSILAHQVLLTAPFALLGAFGIAALWAFSWALRRLEPRLQPDLTVLCISRT